MTESSRPLGPNPEPPVAHIDALHAGERLGEFEILNLLGVGGFGMVYRAYDHSLHRTVAIKEYMPSALAGRSSGQSVSTRSTSDQATLASGLRSFVSEARLLAQFEHPSLVKVYRFWEANNTAYMVMPLYSGVTFRQARAQLHQPPTEAWLRCVLWSILGALKYLHENNIVHRDVSPDNIFLQDAGPPILLDLGAARRAISDANQKHTAILKVNYAPIEQYAGAADLPQGPWTDLYSIAAVVHGCLCNEAPLPATFRVLRDGMPPFASVASTVQTHFGQSYSREFVQAIAHALAIQPNDRPQSVRAFSDEMGLHPPVDIQQFSWREGLDLLETRVLMSASSGVTQPQPAQAFEATVIHTKTVDLRATQPGQGAGDAGDADPADLTQPGPLAQDSTSLTTDSVFSGLVGATHPRHVPASAVAGTASAPALASQAAAAPGGTAKPAASGRSGLVAALIAAVVLFGGLAFLGAGKQAPEPTPQALPVPAVVAPPVKEVRATPEAEIINETPAKPAAVAAVPASAPTRPAMSASGSKSGNAGGSVAGGGPVGVAGNAAGAGAPGMASVASAPGVPKRPASAPASVSAAEAAPTRANSPATPAEPRPAAVQERRGPVENCASSNFLTRPMCIFQECEKPEFSRSPYCVENRRRQQESAAPINNR